MIVENMYKKIFTLIPIFVLPFLLLGTISHTSMVAVNTTSSTATIYLEPQTSFGEVGQNFTIKINISDVVDLYGWEIRLKWNSTILDALAVAEGSFLKSGGNTFLTYKVNNTLGNVIVDCTLLGSVSGVSGSGTLATLQFYVETVGECPLDLYDTILINSAEQSIEHVAVDGYYYTSVHDVAVVGLGASHRWLK